jgi:quercetin dioxygenase-like cupin family protein
VTRTDNSIPDRFDGENGATARFRPFSNPATGERIQFTTAAEDSGEDIVRFKWRSRPGGSITEHVHPHQEERFTIIAGEAHFTVNGEERVVGAGRDDCLACWCAAR